LRWLFYLVYANSKVACVARFVGSMSWFYFERERTLCFEMASGRDPASVFRSKRVGLIGFDEVTALNLIGPADSFAAAALDDGYGNRISCYEVHTIGVFSDRLRTENGLFFQAQHTLSSAPEVDTIIIAGGHGVLQPEIRDKIATWILKRISDTRRLGAVGTGVYALAATGLLNGREVTTHWRFARDLARQFPRLRIDHRKSFVRDGPYYTSTGLSGGVNLAVAMIGEDYGPHVAQSMEEELTLRLTQEDQDATPVDLTSSENYPIDRFSELVAWVMRNLNADLSVEALARRACMCPSHFSKVFKSILGEPPRNFVHNLRLNEARRRLLKRQQTLRTVSESVGFKTSLEFQESFQRKFGARPSTYLKSQPPPKLALSNG
jgi:transcriptional regulator GlxA family with amidase domain